MLDMSPFKQECEELGRGDTVRLNHDDCPAGQDTRRRLYLTRPSGQPNVVTAFCHNCQDWGIDGRKHEPFRDFNNGGQVPTTVPFEVPANLTYDPLHWPDDAKVWQFTKNMSNQQIRDLGIAYDASTHRVYLPMWKNIESGKPVLYGSGEDGYIDSIHGFQLRQIDGRGPKYLTGVVNQDTTPFTRINAGPKDILFMVEDLASGMALEYTKADSVGVIVNYGVKIKPEIMVGTEDMGMGVVWLDNDSQHVKDRANDIQRTWRLVSGRPVHVEIRYEDPKSCSEAIIKNAITDWRGEL